MKIMAVFSPCARGWLAVSLIIYLFICWGSRMTPPYCFIILLHHAPLKVASVLVLFVIFEGLFLVLLYI